MLGLAAAALSACTSSAGGTGPSSPSVSSPPATSSTPISASASLPGSSATKSGPITPPRPSLPPDVPRHGPNTKPGEKPPIMPLEATQHTPDGAKAFAEFFIKTIDWGYATTSSAYMRHHFTHACIGCRSTADAIDKARRKNHHFIGDRITIRAAEMVGLAPDRPVALATFDVTSAEAVDMLGNYVDAAPALTGFRERITLSWRAGRWLVLSEVPQT